MKVIHDFTLVRSLKDESKDEFYTYSNTIAPVRKVSYK